MKRLKRTSTNLKVNLFLDSGAFSAWTKGIKIDIDEYIAFIKKYESYIEVYANLDDIKDPEITYQNQKYMESKGLKPLPCFHYGEDINYLIRYLDEGYSYIALGGMVGKNKKHLIKWLDKLFYNYLTDKKGFSKVKVHGFGVGSVIIMLRYPWYSVDSTVWVKTSRFGDVLIPIFKNGKYDYYQIPLKISFSDRKGLNNENHYGALKPIYRRLIDRYLKEKNYTHQELTEDYKKRDELNIIYFLDLEKNFSDRPFNRSLVKRGFFR